MRRLAGGLIVVCCLLLLTDAVQAGGLVRITERVYAYVDAQDTSPANSFGANAGIIIGEKGIAVVDTLVSAKEAQRFLRDIAAISGKPVKYVINTHHHLDHAFGNAEFSRLGAIIIAHAEDGDTMRQQAANTLANADQYGLTPEDLAGTEIACPELTFSDRLHLDLGGVAVELIYLAPSHSAGSILVHLPGEKVVFAGDILFTDVHPYMGEGDIPGWQRTLDLLAGLEAETIIPGHGPISNKKDVAAMKEYIAIFDRGARELAAGGANDPEASAAEMKKILPPRTRGEWLIGANLKFKYLAGASPKP